jgi:uncharacterized membrane protein YoaK (UPF0700 family)
VLIDLTFVTGMVDAVTYLDVGHVFAANMTGNAVLLGFALGGADVAALRPSAEALAAFLVGALLSGRLARSLEGEPQRWITTALLLEIVLLLGALAGVHFRSLVPGHLVLSLLAVAMGARTATVRRIGITDFSTTVVTTLLAALASDTQLGGGARDTRVLRTGAFIAMVLGAAVGTVLLKAGGPALALTVAVCVVLFATATYRISLRQPASGQAPHSAADDSHRLNVRA